MIVWVFYSAFLFSESLNLGNHFDFFYCALWDFLWTLLENIGDNIMRDKLKGTT